MTAINTDYNNTYLTQSWLDSHKGASEALNANPEFVSFLNSNPDYAKSFTESPDGAQAAAQAAVDSGAIQNEAMGRLLGDASLAQGTMGARDAADLFKDYNDSVTSDWLQEHPGAAQLLSQHPELADFLNANPDYAKDFVDSPDGATKAMDALLAQQPDLGWTASDLVPGGMTVQGTADQGEATGSDTAATTTEQAEQTAA